MTDKDKLMYLFNETDKECDNKDCLLCKYWNTSYCKTHKFMDKLVVNNVTLLPCKVGDTLYTNYDHLSHKETNEIFECKVVFIGFCENGNYINLMDNYGHLHSMDFETFGKTVFLTREEAEKALEKSNVND